jgi:hypothetical protein
LQGIEIQVSDDMEKSATDDESEIKSHILFMPGPFTTPRAVYKTIRFSKRTVAQRKFQEIVHDLEEKGLGKHIEFNKNESAYYKPLPSIDIQAKLEPHLGQRTWEEYCATFKDKQSEKVISASQQQRLLGHHPEKDKLKDYGL